MSDQDHMALLQAAKKLIMEYSSKEDKRALFEKETKTLSSYKAQLEGPENKFTPHSELADTVNFRLFRFIENLTGTDFSWITDEMIKYNSAAGRNKKYSPELRWTHCFFIAALIEHGSSKRQAIQLVARLNGDNAMSEGFLRELSESYKEYEIRDVDESETTDIFESVDQVVQLLSFDISHLTTNEKASIKAAEAFKSFCQQLLELMRAAKPLIEETGDTLEYYGTVRQWIEADYEDPLDNFFKHPSHKKDRLSNRIGWLNRYLIMAGEHVSYED